VQVHDRLADGKPQPEPAETPRDAGLPLLEGFEDPGQHFRVDADAGVRDGEGEG
jgi:hypothetical protein